MRWLAVVDAVREMWRQEGWPCWPCKPQEGLWLVLWDEKPEEWHDLDFYVLTRITLAAIGRIDRKGQRWKQGDLLVGITAFIPNWSLTSLQSSSPSPGPHIVLPGAVIASCLTFLSPVWPLNPLCTHKQTEFCKMQFWLRHSYLLKLLAPTALRTKSKLPVPTHRPHEVQSLLTSADRQPCLCPHNFSHADL